MKKIFVLFLLAQSALANLNPPSFRNDFDRRDHVVRGLRAQNIEYTFSDRDLLVRFRSNLGPVIDLTGYAASVARFFPDPKSLTVRDYMEWFVRNIRDRRYPDAAPLILIPFVAEDFGGSLSLRLHQMIQQGDLPQGTVIATATTTQQLLQATRGKFGVKLEPKNIYLLPEDYEGDVLQPSNRLLIEAANQKRVVHRIVFGGDLKTEVRQFVKLSLRLPFVLREDASPLFLDLVPQAKPSEKVAPMDDAAQAIWGMMIKYPGMCDPKILRVSRAERGGQNDYPGEKLNEWVPRKEYFRPELISRESAVWVDDRAKQILVEELRVGVGLFGRYVESKVSRPESISRGEREQLFTHLENQIETLKFIQDELRPAEFKPAVEK